MLPAAVLLVRLFFDFEERHLQQWSFPSAADWEIGSEANNHFLNLRKAGPIGAPRRPLQFALVKDLCLGDFTLRVKVRRAGRSMLIVFGYVDTLHFYYAHLSADSGDHRVHNGLFKVDGGERFRLAGEGAAPALPDQNWHEAKIARKDSSGDIQVFIDGDQEPRFRHADASFRFGRIGLGSFDETGSFDDLRVEGESSHACK